MSIFYILLLFACFKVFASRVAEQPEFPVHKDIGWKDAGSKSNLNTEEAEHIVKFQSFAAPDRKVAQNQTVEEAEHIAEYYIEVVNKLVKANNFTELALYFYNEFPFYVCIRNGKRIDIDRDDFLKLVYNEQANWKLVDAGFWSENNIFLILDMNMFGYVESIIANLLKQPDGSWQWRGASCRLRTCVDPKNT